MYGNKVFILIMVSTHFLLHMGCALGPDFQRPAPPQVTAYTSTSLSTEAAVLHSEPSEAQNIIHGVEIKPDWWKTMGCVQLDKLIDEALLRHPSLLASEATLRQAKEIYESRAGSALYPQVDGNISAQRQRINPAVSGQSGGARDFNLYNAGVNVRYTFDLAGVNRRALEALAARSEYRQFQLDGARLTIATNIVATAITEASLKRQIELMENILKAQERQQELTLERIRLGHGKQDDALAFQTQLELTRAKLPSLLYQLQQTKHLLAFLAGKAPEDSSLPSFILEDFKLPSTLPLLIPSELIRARPDILGAEALLHVANAEYGVAVARLYPQLNLSANLGSQALTNSALFGEGTAVWGLLGQLTQPLFNLGLSAEKRAALAAFDAAAANYQTVVLEALRNVADVLRALEYDSKKWQALLAADSASEKSLESTERRYKLGVASYYDVLIAQQIRYQAALDLIAIQATRLVNSSLFYQAMGGGASVALPSAIKVAKTEGALAPAK